MDETKDFPTAVIASLSTGIMLCNSFSDIHQAAEFLMGHSIWTHHFADKELHQEIKRQSWNSAPECPRNLKASIRTIGMNTLNGWKLNSVLQSKSDAAADLRRCCRQMGYRIT